MRELVRGSEVCNVSRCRLGLRGPGRVRGHKNSTWRIKVSKQYVLLPQPKMYPLYPLHHQHTALSVRFAVPSPKLAKRILNDGVDHDSLRIRAAANLLFPHIECLARLMSRYRIQIVDVDHNQLGVTLFLPPPPCPAPNSTQFTRPVRVTVRRPQLDTIIEEPQEEESYDSKKEQQSEWMTLYKYVPVEARQSEQYLYIS
jgi:hypothetical protein